MSNNLKSKIKTFNTYMVAFLISLTVMTGFVYGISSAVDLPNEYKMRVCEEHTVVEIVSFFHRTAKVKLDNNQIIELNQPSKVIKKGSVIPCCKLISKTETN